MNKLTKRSCMTIVALLLSFLSAARSSAQESADGVDAIYQRFCASCHGRELQGGTTQSMVDGVWQFGAGRGDMFRNIKFGISSRGMPDYKNSLSDRQVNELIDYILAAQNRLGVERPPLPEKLETRMYDVGVRKWVGGLLTSQGSKGASRRDPLTRAPA